MYIKIKVPKNLKNIKNQQQNNIESMKPIMKTFTVQYIPVK